MNCFPSYPSSATYHQLAFRQANSALPQFLHLKVDPHFLEMFCFVFKYLFIDFGSTGF